MLKGMGSFHAGLLHPLIDPASVLVMLGAALLIAQAQEARQGWAVGSYVATYFVALLVSLWTGSPVWVSSALLVASATVGIVVALASPWLRFTVVPIAMVAGFLLGLAVAPEEETLRGRLLAMLGALICGVLGVLAVVGYTYNAQRQWLRIGIRIVGSWIAAASIMVLALALKGGSP